MSVLISAFLFSPIYAFAADVSPDAVGIRVMPNPNHFSPLVWYKDNIRQPSTPQNLIVDGYEAVRDGRTVYVNAANIAGNNLYTNIYIISYSQEAENSTIDIFGQMLAHWKFNSNISQAGACSVTAGKNCVLSSDCPSGEYCAGPKAKIIRDVKRLSDLYDIKSALESYKTKNDFYPKLSSGTYLANKTLSVWPSWRQTLSSELGASLPVDPINKLGACGTGYDAETCWNQEEKKFDGSVPGGLPEGSKVFAYTADKNGVDYNLCANWESGFKINPAPASCSR